MAQEFGQETAVRLRRRTVLSARLRPLGLGPLGRVGPLWVLAALAVGGRPVHVVLLAAVALLWAGITAPRALGALRSRFLLAYAGMTLLPFALWYGPADWVLAPGRVLGGVLEGGAGRALEGWLLEVAISRAGLAMGLGMLARGVSLWLCLSVTVAEVPLLTWSAALERLGLRDFGFTLGVAFQNLPAIQQMARTTWYAFRMRGGWRVHGWRGLRLVLVTVITNALRLADDVALAAQVRGYGRGVRQPRGLGVPRAADVAAVAFWALTGLAVRLAVG